MIQGDAIRDLCRFGEDRGKIERAYGSAARGSDTIKAIPCPTRLFARTPPFMACARCLTIANPSPVPPISRERALSTR